MSDPLISGIHIEGARAPVVGLLIYSPAPFSFPFGSIDRIVGADKFTDARRKTRCFRESRPVRADPSIYRYVTTWPRVIKNLP